MAALDRAVRGSPGRHRDRPDQDLAQRRRPALRRRPAHRRRPGNPSTAPSHELEEALEGEIEAEIISSSDEPDNAALLERYGTLLEVYVPILYGDDPEPAGVFELYLPYEPVRASIRADTLRAIALLVAGLVVLWLGLFRTVASASRRLRAGGATATSTRPCTTR